MVSETATHNRRSLWKTRWPGFFLLLADIAGFAAVWKLAYHTRRALNPVMGVPINEQLPYFQVLPFIVATGLMNAGFFGLYNVRRRVSSVNSWEALLKTSYHHLLYMMVIGYFLKELDLGRSVILLAGVYGFVYLYSSRTTFRALKKRAISRGRGTVRAAIVGTGQLARQVREGLIQHPDIGFHVLGYIRHPEDPEDPGESGDTGRRLELPVLGQSADIESLVRTHELEEVFLAVPHLSHSEQLNLISLGRTPGLRIQLVSDLFGVILSRAKVDEIARFPVVTLRDGHLPAPQAFIKRIFDLVVSAAGIVAWILFMHWWVALWIRIDSPGPAVFSQTRVGRDGKRFKIYKYRTMRQDADPYATAPVSGEDPRITRVGRWLRKTSLDELPQLLNVFLGDMSMVGPRPEMPFIVEQYEEWQKRRLDVKPGITGLWQVIGRKNLPLHLNMEYDFYYIMNQSILMDIEILIRTVPAVLKGRGAF